jgi:hypothetical protein
MVKGVVVHVTNMQALCQGFEKNTQTPQRVLREGEAKPQAPVIRSSFRTKRKNIGALAGQLHNLQGSFFFAVQATAIFLPVEAELSVALDSFVPACTPIPVDQGKPVLFRKRFAGGS